MKKIKICLLALTVLVAATSFGQDDKKKAGGNSLSVGAEVGLPMGTFGDFNKLGIGGSAKAAFGIFEGGAVTLSAGYMTFSGKDYTVSVLGQTITVPGAKANIIPVKAGLRYMLGGGIYAEPQLGMSFLSGGGGSAFTYAAGVGTMINNQIDIGVRYESFSKGGGTSSFIGARVAYSFGF